MAIRPIVKYAGQTAAVTAAYPHGSAQNVIVQGDGTGTPLEKDWVNDLWGWQQALLSAGSVTPSGNPDEVGASDYLTAMRGAQRVLLSPPQITSAQSNYSPTGWSDASVVRLSSNALQSINGLDSSARVKTKLLINTGANGINLQHLAGGQTAGNQISAPSSAVYLLGAGDTAVVDCDTTSGVWRIVGGSTLAATRAWTGVHTWGASFSIAAGTLSGTGAIDLAGPIEGNLFTLDHSTNEYLYKSTRQRTFWLPACEFVPGTGASLAAGNTIQFSAANAFCVASLNKYLPTGASVIAVLGRVNQNAGPSIAMRGTLLKTVASLVTPFSDTITTLWDVSLTTGTSGDKVVGDGFPNTVTGTMVLPATAAKTTFAELWTLGFTASDAASGGNPEQFMGALISYMDPGPRNA